MEAELLIDRELGEPLRREQPAVLSDAHVEDVRGADRDRLLSVRVSDQRLVHHHLQARLRADLRQRFELAARLLHALDRNHGLHLLQLLDRLLLGPRHVRVDANRVEAEDVVNDLQPLDIVRLPYFDLNDAALLEAEERAVLLQAVGTDLEADHHAAGQRRRSRRADQIADTDLERLPYRVEDRELDTAEAGEVSACVRVRLLEKTGGLLRRGERETDDPIPPEREVRLLDGGEGLAGHVRSRLDLAVPGDAEVRVDGDDDRVADRTLPFGVGERSPERDRDVLPAERFDPHVPASTRNDGAVRLRCIALS